MVHEDATPCSRKAGWVGTTKASGGRGCVRKKQRERVIKEKKGKGGKGAKNTTSATSKKGLRQKASWQAQKQQALGNAMWAERMTKGKTSEYRKLERELDDLDIKAFSAMPRATQKSLTRRARKKLGTGKDAAKRAVS